MPDENVNNAEAVVQEQQESTVLPIDKAQRVVLGELADLVFARDKILQSTISALIAARQLYAVGYKDLSLRLAKYTPKQRKELYGTAVKHAKDRTADTPDALNNLPDAQEDELFDLLEHVFLQSTSGAAGRFTSEALQQGLKDVVIPWMEKVVPFHDQAEREYQLEVAKTQDDARRARRVPLGIKFDAQLGSDLSRDKPLILVGWGPAVLWVLDQMVQYAIQAHDDQLYAVARLFAKAPKIEPNKQLCRIGGKAWENCCRTNKSFYELFAAKLLPQLQAPLDLLVVDDLPYAVSGVGLIQGDIGTKTNVAQKRLHDFCRKAGAALIGAVPLLDGKLPNLNAPAWEACRNFCNLRVVQATEVGEQYSIVVGNTEAVMADKAAITERTVSKLIL